MTLRIFVDRLALFILFVAGWEATAQFWGDIWVSSPWLTSTRLSDVIFGGEIFRHAWFTLQAGFWGFVIGGVPAVILPFVLRRFPKITAVLDPYFVGGYGMPKLSLAPVFILWFGVGMESKIALVASMTFFLLFFNTHAGVQAVNIQLMNMARVVGATEKDIARHIVWPAAVPSIFAGLRIAAPHAIGGAVIGEVISSDRGLGFMIQAYATDFDTTGVVTALVALTVIVVGVYYCVDRVERYLLSWRPVELGMQRMMASMT
jgi:NitT/TauT family transport system permease protein